MRDRVKIYKFYKWEIELIISHIILILIQNKIK
jgi:hypothetical protein